MRIVTIAGEPVDFKEMVLALDCHAHMPAARDGSDIRTVVRVQPYELLGTGSTEDEAWFDAWKYLEHQRRAAETLDEDDMDEATFRRALWKRSTRKRGALGIP